MREKSRYYALDAMRGIGAISVLLVHLEDVVLLVPAGSLAVDFFFALSGFVISLAYSDRLSAGMKFAAFAWQRILRLYPVYLIGLLLGVMAFLSNLETGKLSVSAGLRYVVFGLLMLPTPGASGNMFALNSPAWTLFFEMLINAAFAFCLFRLPTRTLVLFTIGCGLLLVGAVLREGDLGGWTWATFHIGLLRVSFSFAVGMLVARSAGERTTSWWSLLPMLVFGAILYVPLPERFEITRLIAGIVVVSPLCLVSASLWELPGLGHFAATWLGDLSYPLYATHVPVIVLLRPIATMLGLGPVATILLATFCAVVVAYTTGAAASRVGRYIKNIYKDRTKNTRPA